MSAIRHKLVPVGELYVSADPELLMFTCVGSCCAVVLYDAVVNIAGMLHIVLPGKHQEDRTGQKNSFYADSGIPLLVNEMEQLGASKKHLTATVCGGACLIEGGDPGIGRSNTETALVLLDAAGIPVARQQVGGREGRVIEISVAAGDILIRTTPVHTESLEDDAEGELSAVLLDTLVKALEGLQPDPAICTRLFTAIHADEINWQRVEELVYQDVVLTLQLLQKCNSSYYGLPQGIDSFATALSRLGAARLRRICVVVAAQKNHKNRLSDVGLDQTMLSRHCLLSAEVTQLLAGELGPEFTRQAYTAALLHTTSYIVARYAQENKEGYCRKINCSFLQRDGGAACNAHLARALLRRWNFPPRIVDSSSPLQPPAEDPELALLMEIVQAACGIGTMMGSPDPGSNLGLRQTQHKLLNVLLMGDPDRMFPAILRTLSSKGLLNC